MARVDAGPEDDLHLPALVLDGDEDRPILSARVLPRDGPPRHSQGRSVGQALDIGAESHAGGQ